MNKHGWTYKKLGEVCEVERGGSPRPIQQYITDSEDGINWIKIGDAQDGSKYITSTKEKIIPEGVKKSRLVHCGDFILSNSMSFGRPYILKVDGCIHDGWLVIRDKHETFMKDYLYYYLSSPTLYRTFTSLAVGGVVNNLNSKLVRNVDVLIPPKEDQEAIVVELDEINETIEALQQQVADLDTFAQSTFYDMFGDPEKNPFGFSTYPLGELCMLKAGKAIKANQLSDKKENRYPCYGGNGVRGFIDTYSHSGIYPIIGRQGALCGNINLAQGKFYATEHAVVASPIKEMNALWLYYALQFMHLEKYAHGVAQPGLSVKDLNPLILYYPPLALQQEFAAKVEAIESTKTELNAQIAEMQTLLASRMDYYFG